MTAQKPDSWNDGFWQGLILLAFLIFWGPLVKIQPALVTGDMGRDIYGFWRTSLGEWPCRDYWWQYGPLAPLYFAFWFWVGGVHLMSVRLALGFLLLICSLGAYRTLRLFVSAPLAFLSSLAFLSLDVAYSTHHVRLRDIAHGFNQYGVLPFLLFSIYFLWKFFLTRRVRWCYGGIFSLGAIALVKISTGASSFAAFFVSLLMDRLVPGREDFSGPLPWKHFIFLPLLFALTALAGYVPLYWGLPFEWIDQCLTLKRTLQVHPYSFSDDFKHGVLWFLVWDRKRLLWLAGFFIIGILGVVHLIKEGPARERKVFALATFSALLYGVFNSLDYFVDGVIHRVDFWFFPILVLLMGLWGDRAAGIFPRKIRAGLGVLIFFLVLWIPFENLKEALAWRTPERFLRAPHGQVFLGGSPSFPRVLNEGTDFILQHTQPGQSLLAVPFDPLYCFLTGRRHAVRELLFTEYMQISETREEEIIQELENEQVPFVIVSNRLISKEWGFGQFGKTFLTKLAPYLAAHYREAATFGPWESGNYLNLHAIKVLERIS